MTSCMEPMVDDHSPHAFELHREWFSCKVFFK